MLLLTITCTTLTKISCILEGNLSSIFSMERKLIIISRELKVSHLIFQGTDILNLLPSISRKELLGKLESILWSVTGE